MSALASCCIDTYLSVLVRLHRYDQDNVFTNQKPCSGLGRPVLMGT